MEFSHMSLQVRIESLVQRLAAVFKTIDAQMGTLQRLSTDDKTSLVAAINELRDQLAQAGGGTGGGGDGGQTPRVIVDDSPQSTDTTFSAAKITSLLDALKSSLLGGADGAFDTLKELQEVIEQDQTGLRALLIALDARVRVDGEQSLTLEQQALARRNIGAQEAGAVGDTDTDFVAVFDAALGSNGSSTQPGGGEGGGNDTVGGGGNDTVVGAVDEPLLN